VYKLAAHPEVVADGRTGFLAESRKDFEEQLRELISDEGLRSRMGREGREWASRFNWKRCAEEFEKLFKKVLVRRRR
jgi:glycosyltransferase involved in cell wall biosynthesis